MSCLPETRQRFRTIRALVQVPVLGGQALATSVDPREAKSVVFPYFEVLVVYSSTVYVPSLIFASPQPQHTKYPF